MKIYKLFGPPGTGKTTRLLRYLTEETKRLHVSQIAFVSFTREGVNAGRRRALANHGYLQKDCKYFATLHSICFRQSMLSKQELMTPTHYKQFEAQTGIKTNTEETTETNYIDIDVLWRNNPVRAKQVMVDDLSVSASMLTYVQGKYNEYRKKNKVYDYTDLLEMYVQKGKPLPVKVAFVDEAQDLTTLQWRVVEKLFADVDRLYIAGDDDQAIYQWSGADVNKFLSIKADEETVLDVSYRLPNSILKIAQGVSNRIRNRKEKTFTGTTQEGVVKYLGQQRDVINYLDDDTLILCRNQRFLRDIEFVLQTRGVRYIVNGEDTVPLAILNGVRKYESYRKGLCQIEALAPYAQYFTTLNKKELPWFEVMNRSVGYKNYLRAIFRNHTTESKPTVRLSTIHAIKGGEAKTVVLLLDVSASVQRNMYQDPDSELRVLYVGVTRAKQRLIVLLSQSKYSFKL